MQSWVCNYTLEPSGLTDGAATKENDFFPQSISIKLISRERGRTSWAPGWPMAVGRPCLAQVTMQVTTAPMSSCLWWLCCALKTALGSHSLHLRALTPFLLPFPWYSLDLRRDGGINDLFRANGHSCWAHWAIMNHLHPVPFTAKRSFSKAGSSICLWI